jgi:hypothetical protein
MTDSTKNTLTEIKPGQFSLVFEDVLEGIDDAYYLEITFTWGGESAASFEYDSWVNPADPTFVAEINSDPVYGWASWLNDEDVSIGFMHPLASEEGWARIGSRAPACGVDDPESTMADPQTWLGLAKLIHAVASDKPVAGMDRQLYY